VTDRTETTPAEPCFPTEIGLEVAMVALGQKAIELALADGFSTSLRLMQRTRRDASHNAMASDGEALMSKTDRTQTTAPFGTDLYRLQGRKISELSLPDRLRAMASLMHAGSAWGFSGEASWLEEAADKLEATP
jgi:hypothetical protein